MRIGPLSLANRVVCAPMAGISTRAFRDILRSFGAGLVMSEMISAQALVYNNKKTWRMLDMEGEESPVGVQLCGSSPQVMAEAARLVAEKGADLLDINMGCPAPKVVKNGEGAALLLEPLLAAQIVKAVTAAVGIPVTVKMRLGWQEGDFIAEALAPRLAEAGAVAIAVHARHRSQFYSGKADWAALARVAALAGVPVVGNGDVFSPQDAAHMLRETGCAAVMTGRGMLGNPWLVGDTVRHLRGEEIFGRPGAAGIIETALSHLEAEVRRNAAWEEDAEAFAVKALRCHLSWYLKGLPKAAVLREKINRLESAAEIKELLANYLEGRTRGE
ncbi:MAG: tRNA dihydrouridine synthase DusB [Clostridiales bacterium]|nr:tRNA dihydrouridine synthase DusB [Clostridiales bacterium]